MGAYVQEADMCCFHDMAYDRRRFRHIKNGNATFAAACYVFSCFSSVELMERDSSRRRGQARCPGRGIVALDATKHGERIQYMACVVS